MSHAIRLARGAVLSAALMLSAALPAAAETVRVYFGGSFQLGVAGWVEYETQTTDSAVDAGGLFSYGERLRYEGASFSISTAWGTRTGTGGTIQVYNNHGVCFLPTPTGCGGTDYPYFDRIDIQWYGIGEVFQLVSYGSTEPGHEFDYLPSADLPSLFDFPPTTSIVSTYWPQHNTELQVVGRVTLSATPFATPRLIPEPAALWLMLAGVPLLVALARRRQAADANNGTVLAGTAWA